MVGRWRDGMVMRILFVHSSPKFGSVESIVGYQTLYYSRIMLRYSCWDNIGISSLASPLCRHGRRPCAWIQWMTFL